MSEVPVRSLTAASYVIPTDLPEADGTLTWNETTMVVVHVRAGDTVGLGWTYSTRAAQTLISDVLADVVVGCDAADVLSAAARMSRAMRNLGRTGIAAAAISAVDIALWDLKARLLRCPLTGLFGKPGQVTPVYGSGGFTTYSADQLRRQLSYWLHELRIPRVKIKIGESWGMNEDRDLQRVELAREAIGADAELFVDANGAYSAPQAIRLAGQMKDYAVSWFEEPVTSDDLAGLAAIRDQIEPDVAAGEYSWTLADSARLLEAGAVDCLQLDVTRCGGITGFSRAARLAAAQGVPVSGHCAPSLHAHAAAAAPDLRHVEYFHDHHRIEQLLFDGAPLPVDGVLTPDPDRWGHGMTLRAADAQHYQTA
jgi:L-alanine-DL-glutamate epimerase-like enolase superfamily enzyme